jgi:hypothetical protein
MKPINVKSTLANIELVLKTCDISKLNATGYNFLYLMSGFIAHYDINGFKAYYEDVEQLLNDIADSYDFKNAERYIADGFFSKGKDQAYYQSKNDVLIGLRELKNKYSVNVQKATNEKQSTKWDLLQECVRRAETDLDLRQQLVNKVF